MQGVSWTRWVLGATALAAAAGAGLYHERAHVAGFALPLLAFTIGAATLALDARPRAPTRAS